MSFADSAYFLVKTVRGNNAVLEATAFQGLCAHMGLSADVHTPSLHK